MRYNFVFRTPVKAPPTVNVEPPENKDDGVERFDMAEERPKSKRSVSPLNIDPDERYPSFHSPKPDKKERARSKSKSPLAPGDTELPKRNLIPTGRQIERTPQVDLPKHPKVPPQVEENGEDISEQTPDSSRNLSRVSEAEEGGNVEATPALEAKKNVIPLGAQIPR